METKNPDHLQLYFTLITSLATIIISVVGSYIVTARQVLNNRRTEWLKTFRETFLEWFRDYNDYSRDLQDLESSRLRLQHYMSLITLLDLDNKLHSDFASYLNVLSESKHKNETMRIDVYLQVLYHYHSIVKEEKRRIVLPFVKWKKNLHPDSATDKVKRFEELLRP